MQKSKHLRKITILSCLFLLSYNQVGCYIVAAIQRFWIREEMMEQLLHELPDAMLDVIPLEGNERQISWEEQDKEFSFQGEMYDVVRIEKRNGKTFYVCSNDKKETSLLDKINDLVRSGNQHPEKNMQAPGTKLICEEISLLYSSLFTMRSFTNISYVDFCADLPHHIIPIASPPPRG